MESEKFAYRSRFVIDGKIQKTKKVSRYRKKKVEKSELFSTFGLRLNR